MSVVEGERGKLRRRWGFKQSVGIHQFRDWNDARSLLQPFQKIPKDRVRMFWCRVVPVRSIGARNAVKHKHGRLSCIAQREPSRYDLIDRVPNETNTANH